LLSHVAIALLIQVAVTKGLRTSWLAGAAAASAWAIAREITQAEYRWIEQFGGGLRANMPWWGAVDPRVWHADALLDWLVPTTISFGLAHHLSSGRAKIRSALD
jgi:hypothetical protein